MRLQSCVCVAFRSAVACGRILAASRFGLRPRHELGVPSGATVSDSGIVPGGAEASDGDQTTAADTAGNSLDEVDVLVFGVGRVGHVVGAVDLWRLHARNDDHRAHRPL